MTDPVGEDVSVSDIEKLATKWRDEAAYLVEGDDPSRDIEAHLRRVRAQTLSRCAYELQTSPLAASRAREEELSTRVYIGREELASAKAREEELRTALERIAEGGWPGFLNDDPHGPSGIARAALADQRDPYAEAGVDEYDVHGTPPGDMGYPVADQQEDR